MGKATWLNAMILFLGLAGLSACATVPAPNVPMAAAAMPATGLEAQRTYNIIDVLGIGPVYAQKLRAVNITNTGKLLDATTTRYQRQKLAAQAGIPYKLVLGWAQTANLMRIDGIGIRQSKFLAAIGVNSVLALSRRNPQNLQDRLGVANAFSRPFVAGTPSIATATRWVNAAKALAGHLDDQQ